MREKHLRIRSKYVCSNCGKELGEEGEKYRYRPEKCPYCGYPILKKYVVGNGR